MNDRCQCQERSSLDVCSVNGAESFTVRVLSPPGVWSSGDDVSCLVPRGSEAQSAGELSN